MKYFLSSYSTSIYLYGLFFLLISKKYKNYMQLIHELETQYIEYTYHMYTCTILQIFVRGILTIFIFPNKPFQQTSNKIFFNNRNKCTPFKKKKKQPKIIHTELAGIY